MFRPFALFAAVACGRNRFRTGIGQVISFWVLCLVVLGAALLALRIDDAMPQSGKQLWFEGVNLCGFVASLCVLLQLAISLRDDSRAHGDKVRRMFGLTTGALLWVPFARCARDGRDHHTRFEPYACAFIALLFSSCGSVFGLILLIGAISLAAYEAADERRGFEASRETLAELNGRITAMQGTLRQALLEARQIVDELDTVAVLEDGEDPTTPIGRRIDELVRKFEECYPVIFPQRVDALGRPIAAPAEPENERSRDLQLRLEHRRNARGS